MISQNLNLVKMLWLILRSIVLICLLNLKVKEKSLRKKLEVNQMQKKEPSEKNQSKSEEQKTPDFPPRIEESKETKEKESEKESSIDSSLPGSDEEEKINDEDLIEIVEDIIGAGFEVWHLADPSVELLEEHERRRVSKPITRVVLKHRLSRYIKDEFLAIFWLGISISKRIKVKKKDEKNDHRKNRNRKDAPRKTTD